MFAEGDPLYYTRNWFIFLPKPLLDLTEGHKGKARRTLGAAEARRPKSRALRGLNPESKPL